MNGVHDMGGMHGMGPVECETQEPVFHCAMGGAHLRAAPLRLRSRKWNIDMTRYSREQMPPAGYLAASYYERWLFGLEKLLVEQGLVTATELETGRARGAIQRNASPFALRRWRRSCATGRNTRLDDKSAQFKPGDRVIARNIHPVGHTRLPRYARGRRGVIDRDHGVFIFADTNAASRDKKPQHLYSVRFAARELWGPDAAPRATACTWTSGTTTLTRPERATSAPCRRSRATRRGRCSRRRGRRRPSR